MAADEYPSRQSLSRMVRWIDGYRHHFDADSGNAPTEGRFVDGPLLELALSARVLLRAEALPVEERTVVLGWLEVAADVVCRTTTVARLQRQPELVPFYAMLGGIVRETTGVESKLLDRAAQMLNHNVGDMDCASRSANVRLEARWARAMSSRHGSGPVLADASGLFPRTTCGAPPRLLYMSDHETYAITHVLFYLTDFGRAPFPLGRNRAPVTQLIEQLIAYYAELANADLVAELVHCGYALNADSSVLRAAARLLDSKFTCGAVLGPNFDDRLAQKMPDERRAGIYTFRTSYHTTLAALMANSAALEAVVGRSPEHHRSASHEQYGELARVVIALQAGRFVDALNGYQRLQATRIDLSPSSNSTLASIRDRLQTMATDGTLEVVRS